MNGRSEAVRQFLSSCQGAVDNVNILKAAITQRLDYRAAGTAGTEDGRRAVGIPAGMALIEVAGKTRTIGIGGEKLAVLPPQRIGGAKFETEFVRTVGESGGFFLVRYGDIAALEAALPSFNVAMKS